MINSQLVLTNSMKLRQDDVISDVIANRFRLEFSIFGTSDYYNLISFHPMFTKIDMVDNSAVLMILIEWRHDDVISDVTPDRYRPEFSIFLSDLNETSQDCSWWVRKNPIDFFTMTSSVTSFPVKSALELVTFSCEHDNSSKSYPILMKLT